MLAAWCGFVERGGVDGVGAQYAGSPQVPPWRGMADPAAYPGCVGPGMNFAEHPYEGRPPGHCQSGGGGGYPYPTQYRPHPSSPPAPYGPPPGQQQQHCGGGYGNGPVPNSPGPYPRQQPYPGAAPDMRYGPRHSAPPSAYQGSPAPHAKPPGPWDHGAASYGAARPPMMQSPPPIRSPVNNVPPPHGMGGYRSVGPPQSPIGIGPPLPPHTGVPVSQSQSPSWSQSPRTTPSPLACPSRSPAPQQPPFSPPTPAPTPQLQKPPSPMPGTHDPLQSLEKMVLLDPHSGGGGGNMGYNSGVPQEHSGGYGPMGGPDTGPSSPYPTYYNLDQNRMCTPPDPGPPYGVANFAATGCYRAMPPSAENAGLRNERTGSGMPPVQPAGVYPPPMVNGVSDGDFGTGAPPPPPLGAPSRSSDFDRPYAGQQQAAAPPCDDPMKRRRSSDSALCGRPSSVGPAGGPAKVTSPPGAADSVCKLRRRSVAVIPDGSSAPGPRAPSEPPPAKRVKTEPEPPSSEPDPVSASEAASSANTSSSAAPATSPVVSPPKKKRGRPFGAKNKVKDPSAPAGKRKRSKGAAAVSTPAAAPPPSAAPARARAAPTGPYIRVVGTRECPQSSQIVNVAPRTVPEDESKRKKASAPVRVGGPPHHSTGGRRAAGSAAAHTSTLSPHYDAVTRDPTWLCAFCHRGSHQQGLGDLYGPYPGLQSPRPAAEPDLNSCSSSQEEMLRKGRATKRKKSDSVSGSEDGPTSRRVSRQRKTSEAEREPELPKEIWVHETCAVWTQGVYLGGNRVHGLQEAIAEAANLVCSKCKMAGASVGCIMRACTEKYHFICAVEKGCQLNTENFSILCFKHKKANARPS
ncbi:uncharacterized protein LOC144138595 isoform X1 [Haemaphysalis longicornis]